MTLHFENLNAQDGHIQLIKEQNELLVKYNRNLIEELSDKLKETKLYLIPKTKEQIIGLLYASDQMPKENAVKLRLL